MLIHNYALQTLAAAIPNGTPPPPVTPPTLPQCCASVVPASNGAASLVAAVLGLDLSGILVDVGLSCSPITVLGNNWFVLLLLPTYRLTDRFIPPAPEAPPSPATRPRRSGVCSAPAPSTKYVLMHAFFAGGLIAINCIPITL
ncbi:hypothetical protein C8R46DRAFT_1309188 [Mycena filopes]|nr:hypothetical protein C8R46DRAFT_1309188 [Mycena filopes]